jgi:hypothetical protein
LRVAQRLKHFLSSIQEASGGADPQNVPGDDLPEPYLDLAGGISAINRQLASNTLKLSDENDLGRQPPSDVGPAAQAPPAAPLRSDDVDDFMAEPEDENESDFWLAPSKEREGVSQRSSIPMISRTEPAASEKVQHEPEMSSAALASNDDRMPWSEGGIAREIRRPRSRLGTTVLARQKMVAGLVAILVVLVANGILSISRDGSDIDKPDRQYSSTAVDSVGPVAGKLPSGSDQPFLTARRGEAGRRLHEPGAMPRLPCSLHRVTEQDVTPSPHGRAGWGNHVGDMIFYRFHEKDGPCAVITNDITGSNLPKSERGWIADGRTELTEGSESQIGVDVDEVIATIEQEGYYVGSLGSTKHPGKPAGSKLIRLF